MSTLDAPVVQTVEDRWPADGSEVPGDALGQLVLASHLLGEDRRVANFGGGNTSAKGAMLDHTGREVRVIVDAKLVDDKVGAKIARDIAKKIEEEMQYRGEIKVTLIREVRAVEYAR